MFDHVGMNSFVTDGADGKKTAKHDCMVDHDIELEAMFLQ